MKNLWRRNRSFLVAASMLLVVRGTFADQNRVPSGSMEPTIMVGDHIFVNRAAYDLKIPFSEITVKPLAEPQRGDIIVFHNPKSDLRMVKRLIGIPGDHLRIKDGIVYLNGKLIPGSDDGLAKLAEASTNEVTYSETIGSHKATIKRSKELARAEDIEIVVPEGQYFAMGDNRDNSFDSRGWGFIPRAKIVGKAEGVLFNVNWLKIRPERFGLKFS